MPGGWAGAGSDVGALAQPAACRLGFGGDGAGHRHRSQEDEQIYFAAVHEISLDSPRSLQLRGRPRGIVVYPNHMANEEPVAVHPDSALLLNASRTDLYVTERTGEHVETYKVRLNFRPRLLARMRG